MKRYNNTYDIHPEDMVEDKDGQWVDATVAQRLYDELNNLVAVLEGKDGTKPNAVETSKHALKLADEDE
jgi:hypothetical protein